MYGSVGLDIGTTSSKAVVYDDTGQPLASSRRPTVWHREADGTEIDANQLRDGAVETLAEAVQRLPRSITIAGVGITSMGETGVLVDHGGRPVAPAIAWHDRRDDVEVDELRRDIGADTFAARAGKPLRGQFSITKHRWLALNRPPADLPHLIKPNADELAELTGRPLRTLGDVADAAFLLVERGVETVLVSLGGDGAILINDQCALHGEAPVDKVVNTAGAGDAFLAGYLAAAHQPADQRLMSALRFGATAVRHHGTLFSDGDLNQPVYLRNLDRTRHLHTPAH